MSNIVLKITRDGESSFLVCRKAGEGANLDFLSSWDTVNAERIDGGKSIKSGYLFIITRHDKWVCTSDCIFSLDDFIFSIQGGSDDTKYPTTYLLHYEFDWKKLIGQTKLDVVWCSSTYLIDYTTGYQAYRSNVWKNIIEAINSYERKRKNRI